MATQCSDIGSLIQMYLDGELTDRDLHDFEHHVATCEPCRGELERETEFHQEMGRQLAPPPAGDLLRRRIQQALDAEDAASSRVSRRARWNWVLPGAAMVAAAAALIVFATDQLTPSLRVAEPAPQVAEVQVQQHKFSSTRPVPQPVTPTPVLEVPRVDDVGVNSISMAHAARDFSGLAVTLRGFQPTELSGRPAALFAYDVVANARRYRMAVFVVNAEDLDLRTRSSITIDGRQLSVLDHADGRAFAYRTSRNIGYVFVSDMDENTLIGVVANSGLLRK